MDTDRVEAIFFDIDGTLSDTDNLWVGALAARLRPYHRLLPGRDPDRLARRLIMAAESPGNLAYTLLDWAHLDDDLARLVNFLHRRSAMRKPRAFQLVPGVDRLLAQLAGRYPLAVISANSFEATQGFLDHYNLSRHFRCVASGQTCEFTKPFPHPLLWAAAQIGVDPRNCLMVGDTSVDIRAGRNAGAQTAGVLCGFGEERELRRAGADWILPSPCGLPDIL